MSAIAQGHKLRWRWRPRLKVWQAIGHPHVRVAAEFIPVARREYTLVWRLDPDGGLFRDYTHAMLAAEGIRVRLPRLTRTRRPKTV